MSLQWRGRTITLRPLTWKLISELERWLIQREAEARTDSLALMVERGLMSADLLAQRIEAFTDDCVNNGRYSFGSERMNRVLSSVAGQGGELDAASLSGKFKLIALMMGLTIDDAINVMHECGSELATSLAMVLAEGMPPKEPAA